MAQSFTRVVFNGVSNRIPVGYPYLDKSHVKVYLNDVLQPTSSYTWPTSGEVQLNVTPASGVVGLAKRVTPEDAITVFSPGNLDTGDLNVASLQPLYLAQEAGDSVVLLKQAVDLTGMAYRSPSEFATAQQGANGDLALSVVQTLTLAAGEEFTVTDLVLGQTVITVPGGYSTLTEVRLNGATLTPFVDYVAGNGTSITLLAEDGLEDQHIPAVITGTKVVTVAGLLGLDNRYIKRTDIGRDAGDVVAYENLLGSGFQGLGIKDGGRIWFRRDNDKHSDFTNVWITRNPEEYLGPLTGTAHALRVQTTVDYRTNQFEWAAAFVLQVNAGGGGEHCGAYSQAVKNADGSAWAHCFEARDFVQNPTTGTVTIEAGLFVKGGDPLNRRIGHHMALNAADNRPILETGIINKIGTAFVIGGPSTHVRVGSMIVFQGDAEMHLDLTEIDQGYHDIAMGLLPNSKIVVQNPKTVNLDGSRVRGAERASLFWSEDFDTWAFGGVKTQIPAAELLKYKVEVLDGQEYLIPLYRKP